MQPQYIFGGDTGVSYDQLQRQRKANEALKDRATTLRTTAAGGLGAIAEALIARHRGKKLDAQETQGRQQYSDAFAEMIARSQPGSSTTLPNGTTLTADMPRDGLPATQLAGEPMANLQGRPTPRPNAPSGPFAGVPLPELNAAAASPWASPEQKAMLTSAITGIQTRKAAENAPRRTLADVNGQHRYVDSGEAVFPGVEKIETTKPTAAIQEFRLAQQQGFKGTFRDFRREMKQAGASNVSVNSFNVEQGKAAGFADRMRQSEQVIREVEGVGTDLQQKVLGNVPFGNHLVSDDYQRFDQARRDFVNAILRRESGAVISDSEFENANIQYFPQPGDSKSVIEQKRLNRQQALAGIARAGGPSYTPNILPETENGDGSMTAKNANHQGSLENARKAIAAGADPDAVRKRLRENGIDPGGL